MTVLFILSCVLHHRTALFSVTQSYQSFRVSWLSKIQPVVEVPRWTRNYILLLILLLSQGIASITNSFVKFYWISPKCNTSTKNWPVFERGGRGLDPVILLELLLLLEVTLLLQQRRVEERESIKGRLLGEQRRRRAEHWRETLKIKTSN